MNSVLVVCIGNVCRSPVGERVLQDKLGTFRVESAGLGALVDHPVDETAATIASRHGVSVEGHKARQFVPELGEKADLILVMEPEHKQKIAESSPHLSGKIMLFDHWTKREGIPDPFRRSEEFHQLVFEMIDAAAEGWARKLAPNGKKHDV
ncbi:MAG: low molecular weight phosphotyrosine protein phosphatase [Rhodobacteraceae bacterium]|nr:low molecular weight phosphotyrosine protein phosphatase [Paracoccaceae bacterium]